MDALQQPGSHFSGWINWLWQPNHGRFQLHSVTWKWFAHDIFIIWHKLVLVVISSSTIDPFTETVCMTSLDTSDRWPPFPCVLSQVSGITSEWFSPGVWTDSCVQPLILSRASFYLSFVSLYSSIMLCNKSLERLLCLEESGDNMSIQNYRTGCWGGGGGCCLIIFISYIGRLMLGLMYPPIALR